jgi:AGCS family alanine or glycine:cation symporter
METIHNLIIRIADIVWGWPEVMPAMVIILLGTGIYISLSLRGIQIRRIGHAFAVLTGKYDKQEDAGDINHFQALSAALSATVGIGNIAGVATAIYYGGPGALFWMWITAIFGMALKFSEATLAMRYRVINADGSASGGPMYYIERGLGPAWKPLAVLFATLTVISSFATGNSIQAFTVSDQMLSEAENLLHPTHWLLAKVSLFGLFDIETIRLLTGLLTTSLVAAVILGGIQRIGKVAAKLAPGMALLYVAGGLLVIILNYDQIFPTLAMIVREAFAPRAELVGFAGGGFLLFLNTMVWGVKRGLFSNEAGQGSAPIAHAAAKTTEPVREGVVAMAGPLIDTLIICTITGLVILTTGAYEVVIDGSRLNGSPLTALGFKTGLSPLFAFGDKLITVAVFLFAVSTAISWSYYGDRGTEYLFGRHYIRPYKYFFVFFHFVGSLVSLELVWGFGDIALGLMAIPNLIALLLLSPQIVTMTKDYFDHQ